MNPVDIPPVPPVEIQAPDISRWRALRDAADGDVVDPARGLVGDGPDVDPAARFGRHAACDQFHRLRERGGVHIVEQQVRRASSLPLPPRRPATDSAYSHAAADSAFSVASALEPASLPPVRLIPIGSNISRHAITSSLSASGSRNLPVSVTRLRLRAI